MKHKDYTKFAAMKAYLLVFAIAILVFALFGLFILIFLNADTLGYLFIPCFCLYIGFLSLIPIWIYHRREMLQIHAYLGDEAFYARYPKEKKRMLRIQAWKEKWNRLFFSGDEDDLSKNP